LHKPDQYPKNISSKFLILRKINKTVTMVKISKNDALDYHQKGRPGKIEVVPTKPHSTQYDLSLAYTPGVA